MQGMDEATRSRQAERVESHEGLGAKRPCRRFSRVRSTMPTTR